MRSNRCGTTTDPAADASYDARLHRHLLWQRTPAGRFFLLLEYQGTRIGWHYRVAGRHYWGRGGELVLVILVLAVSWPVFLLMAALNRGHMIQKDLRVGRHGREFVLYQFRAGPGRWGRWLRRSRLVRLPELLNVLLGEVTLVGYRPATPAEASRYRAGERARLEQRPGLLEWPCARS